MTAQLELAAGTVAVHCGRLAIWNPRYQVRP